MYVDNLITHISQEANARVIMYADDTVLVTENKNPADAVDKMQEILSRAAIWCRENKLTINAKKTKQMLV